MANIPAEWKLGNNCVGFYLASFKTTLWEAVFIRTLLERVSPGWLTDWLWWGFIRLLHIPLWSTHLQGLFLSFLLSLSVFHFFYSCSLVLSDQANPWSPLNPQWLRAQSIRHNDVKLLSNEYLAIRETVCAGRLMRGFSSRRLAIFLKIAVCYPLTLSLTWLLHFGTGTPIILHPKQRKARTLRDVCCVNIQFRKCWIPGPRGGSLKYYKL